MATNPGDEPDDDRTPDERPNPFAGTPMEQMFSAFTGGGGGQMPDLSQLMSQMQAMFTPHEGSVNWALAKDVARSQVAQQPDPSPHAGQAGAVTDAVRLAELWLDHATDVPAAVTTSAAWSRAEWVEQTMPRWQQLVEPVAEQVVAAMGQAMPAEAKAMAGPLMGLLTQAGGAMYGQQIGQAVAALAQEVVGTTDIGLPMGPDNVAAMLPANVAAFGEGLETSATDVMLYLVLRECAHQRLFATAPWLRPRLFAAVEAYGRGTRIDLSRIEEAASGIDPTNPAALQEALSSNLFEETRTPEQEAALEQLELMLALIEGWVDEVVTEATRDRMPAAAAMRETVRRRRAAGGPAEDTFAALIGLELRPRRMRDAAGLWAALRDREGPAARDSVWAHPDLLPTSADLDDPLGFRRTPEGEAGAEALDFDAELASLLDSAADDDRGEEPDDDAGEGGTPPAPA